MYNKRWLGVTNFLDFPELKGSEKINKTLLMACIMRINSKNNLGLL